MLMSVIENEPSHAEFLTTAHPTGRYGEPAEIGETAAWLLSDASSFVTGAAIAADGGYTATCTASTVGNRTKRAHRIMPVFARRAGMTHQALHDHRACSTGPPRQD